MNKDTMECQIIIVKIMIWAYIIGCVLLFYGLARMMIK